MSFWWRAHQGVQSRLAQTSWQLVERPGLSIGRLNGAGRWWVALSVNCAPEWTDGKLGVFIMDGFLILVLIGFSKL